MHDKDKNDKYKQQKKKALSFTTKRGITFSMLTKGNIKKNQVEKENQVITKNSQDVTDSEVNGRDEYNGNN